MAEARAAAVITRTHTSENALSEEEADEVYSEQLPVVHSKSMRKSAWKAVIRSGFRFRNFVVNALFPGYLPAYIALVTVLTAVVLRAEPDHWLRSGQIAKFMWAVDDFFPWSSLFSVNFRVFYLSCYVGFITALLWSLFCRLSLRLLLSYKGWLHVHGRKIPLKLKVWGLMVKLLSGIKPLTYSFQGALPRLPVPNLKVTCERYLTSVRPVLSDEEYAEEEKLASEFLQTIGPKLQRYLYLKSWFAPNYVTDWWEKYVYLRGRSPIMVNSNYYVFSNVDYFPTRQQAGRAALATYQFLRFKRTLEREEIEPMRVRDMVPICMWQYERLFSTTRIPGKDLDTLVHLERNTSKHIVVLRNGQWYRIDVYHPNGTLLSPYELQVHFKYIIEDADDREPDTYESMIAALTGEERTTWFNAREQYFSHGMNKVSLDAIESAVFCVVLENEVYDNINSIGKSLLHGNGGDRWFDKSFNLVVFPDGYMGMNAEHSYADALVIGHMFEWVLAEEKIAAESGLIDANGWMTDLDEQAGKWRLKKPEQLKWAIPSTAYPILKAALTNAKTMGDNLDLNVVHFNTYGKNVMKSFKLSPDAYLQMALQLAYYRDQGKRFDLTYEAAMTRFFKHGRTETVRPVTQSSCAFVRAMEDPTMSNEERAKLGRIAMTQHNSYYMNCMVGEGVDRHMFALYVVSVGLKRESEFLRRALSRPWRLSTSQQPQSQDPRRAAIVHKEEFFKFATQGGGFGPVADDGYGVSYMLIGETHLFFHISSNRTASNTDSTRFGKEVFRALDDLRAMFEGTYKQ